MVNGMESAELLPQMSEAEKITPDLREKIRNLLSVTHSNIAACNLKLGKYDRAASEAKLALKFDAGNSKAKFRLAQAYIRRGNIDEGEKVLTELRKLLPNGALV